MKKKIWSLLAVCTMACMVFAGCSGGTSGASSDAATEAATEAAAEATTAAAAEATSEGGKLDLASLEDSPAFVANLEQAKDANQLFIVGGIGQTTAYVSMHQKDENGNWKQLITTPGYIGKYGLDKEKEGDAKTPTGTYHFNYAFGINEDPGCTAFDYQQVTDDDYWSGDQREGYNYNQMVSIKDLPDLNTDDSEHIVDYTYQYPYCLNVSWNEDGTPGKGSAIFLHCLGPQKPYTGGCIAIPQNHMITVLQNVDKDCVVVIDSLKNIAPDLWEEWGL